jgi:hypothetical protein
MKREGKQASQVLLKTLYLLNKSHDLREADPGGRVIYEMHNMYNSARKSGWGPSQIFTLVTVHISNENTHCATHSLWNCNELFSHMN